MKPTLILAPIRGITDRLYRNTYPKYFTGIDYAVAPFVASSKQKNIDKNLIKEFEIKESAGLNAMPQLLGKDADDFIKNAHALKAMGYETVNWNLGCPFPMVTNKCKGSGLLCHPDIIASFLEKVIPAINIKLSIKLRLGLNNTDEILKLIPIFNQYPLDDLIIHPRTGKQLYSGTVDLDAFEKCIEPSVHKIIYNGDINSLEDFNMISTRFPHIEKFMIGRGALSNPFLPSEIKGDSPLSATEKNTTLRKFHDDLYNSYTAILSNSTHLLDRMKGEWYYLAAMFPNKEKVQKKIRKANTVAHYNDEVNRIFDLIN